MNDNPELVIFSVSPETALIAIEQVTSCEACSPEAQFPFCWVLDSVIGFQGQANYFLTECIECPSCRVLVTEETLVEWAKSVEEK